MDRKRDRKIKNEVSKSDNNNRGYMNTHASRVVETKRPFFFVIRLERRKLTRTSLKEYSRASPTRERTQNTPFFDNCDEDK